MNTMQLTERYRDKDWAMEQFEKSEYACVAVNGENGFPYNIPICVVRIGDELYFHTAKNGTAPDLIRQDGRACLTCTTHTRRDPQNTTMRFRSAVAMGTISEVTDTDEKQRIMIQFFAKYLPGETKTQAYAVRASMIASVWHVAIDQISGKENK